MLRATHAALRSGGLICFFVISNARLLTDADRARMARRDGNEHVEAARPYDVLMDEAGFVGVELTDVTSQYIETLRGWKEAWEAEADALGELMGAEEYARRMRNRGLDVAHAEEGLTCRFRVFGRRP